MHRSGPSSSGSTVVATQRCCGDAVRRSSVLDRIRGPGPRARFHDCLADLHPRRCRPPRRGLRLPTLAQGRAPRPAPSASLAPGSGSEQLIGSWAGGAGHMRTRAGFRAPASVLGSRVRDRSITSDRRSRRGGRPRSLGRDGSRVEDGIAQRARRTRVRLHRRAGTGRCARRFAPAPLAASMTESVVRETIHDREAS